MWGCGVVGCHQLPEHGAVLDLFKRSKNRVGFSPRKPKLGRSMGREMGGSYPGAEHHRRGCKMWDQGEGAAPPPPVPAVAEH